MILLHIAFHMVNKVTSELWIVFENWIPHPKKQTINQPVIPANFHCGNTIPHGLEKVNGKSEKLGVLN
jgi:hypothetical protein